MPKLTIVHELNQHGQHRIVTVADDGTNSAGEWVATSELASHLNLWACAEPEKGLPEVFTCREPAYQVLT